MKNKSFKKEKMPLPVETVEQWMERHADKLRRVVRLLEFFIVGLVFGIAEDLLAIFFATGEPVTPRIFLIAALVAFPFAVFSELIVDSKKFRKSLEKMVSKLIPDIIEGKKGKGK